MEISTAEVKSYLQPFSNINIMTTEVYTNDCLLLNFIGNPQLFIFYTTLLTLMLPFFLSAFISLVYFFFNFKTFLNFQPLAGNSRQRPHSSQAFFLKKAILFVLICSFLCYGMLIQAFIGMIDCISIDDTTAETFVSSSPNFQCWTGIWQPQRPSASWAFSSGASFSPFSSIES
jgi:hypothetical protein